MNRNGLINHINLWTSKLGSINKVAERCHINVGALSTILRNKYGADETKMLQKIATELNYKESSWVIVKSIGNYQRIKGVWEDAKEESMWFSLANKAGSGKTETLEDLFNEDRTGSVVLIQAEEWSGRQFLLKLIEKTIGIDYSSTGKNYKTIAQLVDIVANYFNDMSLEKPVLMIDEFDKLKSSAKRILIPVYNRTNRRLGLIASGTENFEKEMKQGVRLNKKGYDELDSRFGRTYIHLDGATESEISQICIANGVTSPEIILNIWGELEKVTKPVMVRTSKGTSQKMVDFVEDFRRLERLIKRENLKGKRAA